MRAQLRLLYSTSRKNKILMIFQEQWSIVSFTVSPSLSFASRANMIPLVELSTEIRTLESADDKAYTSNRGRWGVEATFKMSRAVPSGRCCFPVQPGTR
jgi:hypothetical protein